MQKVYYVYIITNYKNSVLYIGVTSNLPKRISQHKKGVSVSSFSKKYRLYKLVWFTVFDNPNDAIAFEKKVKGWRRERKLELIRQTNPKFRDLNH